MMELKVLRMGDYSDFYAGVNWDILYKFSTTAMDLHVGKDPFTKERLYSFWNNPHYLILTDDVSEMDKLHDLREGKRTLDPLPTFKSNDKVYINPAGSSIPSLVFSRWCKLAPLGIKRSVKKDKADYISVNFNTLWEKVAQHTDDHYRLGDSRYYHLYIIKGGKYYRTAEPTDKYNVLTLKNRIENTLGVKCYFGIGCRGNSEAVKSLVELHNVNNVINEDSLIQYIWSKLPIPTKEFMQTICSQLKSASYETISMAVDTMHNFNWQPYMFDIYKTIPDGYLYYLNNSELNANQKFLYHCLNVNRNGIINLGRNRFSYSNFFSKDSCYMTNPLLCLPERDAFLDSQLTDIEQEVNHYFGYVLSRFKHKVKLFKIEEGLTQRVYNITSLDSIIAKQLTDIINNHHFSELFKKYQIGVILVEDV